jgi:hypothetical protein
MLLLLLICVLFASTWAVASADLMLPWLKPPLWVLAFPTGFVSV